jgi:type II secretory pathway pseudopilin PulG
MQQQRRGFSLLEVMFAGSILLLGLSAVAGVFSTASNSFAHQRDVAGATTVAEGFLEQIVILPSSSPLLDVGAHDARHFTRDGRPTTATSTTAAYALTWVVVMNQPVSGMKRVTVTVSWTHDRAHSLELFTFRE